jgi:hypothetical protein
MRVDRLRNLLLSKHNVHDAKGKTETEDGEDESSCVSHQRLVTECFCWTAGVNEFNASIVIGDLSLRDLIDRHRVVARKARGAITDRLPFTIDMRYALE